VEREIREIVAERYRQRVDSECADLLQRLTERVVERTTDPYSAAEELIAKL
jgi:hypothetical protein